MKNCANNTFKPLLNLVVALPCEAKPLIQWLQLKKNLAITAFAVYQNLPQRIQLIISGVGSVHCAAATSFIAGLNSQAYTCFCNIGIAGSDHIPLGDIIAANKLQSQYGNFFPQTHLLAHLNQDIITSVTHASVNYPLQGGQDMEAASFFQVARKFVSQEMIQVIKIISDNHADHFKKINTALVTELFHKQQQNLLSSIHRLLTFSQQEQAYYQTPQRFNDIINRLHFTQHQQQQLMELLRQAEALNLTVDIDASTAKSYLIQLKDYLQGEFYQ